MNQSERRIWLIQQLLNEKPEYKRYQIPQDEQGQKDLLRALMNVRMPDPIDDEFLRIQDDYLREETNRKGIVELSGLSPWRGDDRIYLWQGDMSRLQAEAVVDPCNDQLLGCFRPLHNCLDNILHSAAGIQLRLKCNELMQTQRYPEPAGSAKITPAYNLPADYVIHTVGPIVQGPLTEEHERLLASCYTSCLNLVAQNGLKSIAFCCISTGVFMFPNQRAAEIAVETVCKWLAETGSDIKVVFNVFKDEDLRIYERILK